MDRHRSPVSGLLAALVLSVLAVAAIQPRLAGTFRKVKAKDDVYVLPPPEQLVRATMGYRSAAADILWAQLLVEYGRHWADKQPFPDLEKYLDAILALEPGHPSLYRFVDTLLVFRPILGTEADARKARAYLERGLRERPLDKDVWLRYGQFIAFLAPSFLTSESEREQWRMEGAEAIIRSTELGGIVDRALSATAVLSRAGRRAAALEYLERAHALTDDPSQLAEIEARLEKLQRELAKEDAVEPPARRVQRQRREARARAIDGAWRTELPFVSRGEFLLLGPFPNPLACTGPARHDRPDCALHWNDALSRAVP